MGKKEKYQPLEYVISPPHNSKDHNKDRLEPIILLLEKTFSFLLSFTNTVVRNITLKGIRTALITVILVSPVYLLLEVEIDRRAAVQKIKDDKAIKKRADLRAMMYCYKVSSLEALKKVRRRSRGCRI